MKSEQFTYYNKHFTCSLRALQLALWLPVSAMIWQENPQDEHLDLVLLTNHKLWSKCQKPPSLLPTSWKKAASHPAIVRYFPGLSTSTGQEAKPPAFFSATMAWTRPQANSARCICIDIQAQLSTQGIWYSSKPYEWKPICLQQILFLQCCPDTSSRLMEMGDWWQISFIRSAQGVRCYQPQNITL